MQRVCKNCSIIFEGNGKKVFCCRSCMKKYHNEGNPNLMRSGNRFTTAQAYIQRVELFTSKFEFIDSSDDFLMIMCKDCGLVFNRSKVVFKPSHRHKIECPNCSKIITEVKEKDYLEAEKLKKAQKAEQKSKLFWSQKFNQLSFEFCDRCGSLTVGKRYCSDKCRRRAEHSRYNATKEAARRIRIKAQLVDRDITLEKVYQKSNGICYLCNKPTNFGDSEWRDGAFIVGESYPTIEHIIPLSKGGLHSWDNVKCACFKCNTMKGSKLYG